VIPEEKVLCYYEYGFVSQQIYPTGKCKRVDITVNDVTNTSEYVQARRYIFGIPLWTFWISKEYIVWKTEKVIHYDCETKQPKIHGTGGAGRDF
jgi:hypothetical protein